MGTLGGATSKSDCKGCPDKGKAGAEMAKTATPGKGGEEEDLFSIGSDEEDDEFNESPAPPAPPALPSQGTPTTTPTSAAPAALAPEHNLGTVPENPTKQLESLPTEQSTGTLF